ncbi:hypothetical protein [Pseudovibrio sp. Tun.PSC04-5.I4]|uniref:hypothetical protein n=1 Tax=Pseudovibrio sp. Tun.PSC04-5.I4 TaxID=1798213 RepID=UPI0032977CD2
MIYRKMNLSDREAVIALWKATGVYRKWNDPVRDILKALDGEHSTILLGELNGAVVASIMCGEDGHRGWRKLVARPRNMEDQLAGSGG